MDRGRVADLVFEIKDFKKNNEDRYDRAYLIISYLNLKFIKKYIKYINNYEAKLAKMILTSESATLVGYINQLEVFAVLDFDKNDYMIGRKPRSMKERIAFEKYIPKEDLVC